MSLFMTPLEGAASLKEGKIIAYPTEAVFGLGCNPLDETAVKALLTLKQRPWEKGLILIASCVSQLLPFLNIDALSDDRWQHIQSTWPGPFTWVIPCASTVSPLLRGQHQSIAVRVTAHPVAKALCAAYQGAIVSTSANQSEMAPLKTTSDVKDFFGHSIAGVVTGAVGDSLSPTQIQDALTFQIYRQSVPA
jgi:L-threonylcarbamoyladenylate synthase